MPAEDSLARGCLPLGLAQGCTLQGPIARGTPVTWQDVALDPELPAVQLRREMQEQWSP
jgi:predicted homoserine dehydrogenase-like protein